MSTLPGTSRQRVGGIILIVVFAGLFVFATYFVGIKVTAIAFTIAILWTAALVSAVNLLVDGSPES